MLYFSKTTKSTKTDLYNIQLLAKRYKVAGISCDAVYDNSISAHVTGKWVTVKRQGEVL